MELNKNVEVLKDKIFYIKDFLFPETCNFLVSTFSGHTLVETDKPGIFRSIGTGRGEDSIFDITGFDKMSRKTNNESIDIGIDFFTGILTNIEKTSSKLFNKDLVLKSYFYSHMKKGGKNSLHVDNYSEEYANDYSVILYLTNTYSGGLLIFPDQDLILKPQPGTLVAFIGTDDLKHEVTEVIDGDRVNLICFLKEKNK
jgi:hypothetical protein